MQIPYLCHRDLDLPAEGPLDEFREHFRVIGDEFEEYMKQQGLGRLYEEAENIVGKTRKVMVGRYLGNHIEPNMVPEKFVELLREIISVADTI